MGLCSIYICTRCVQAGAGEQLATLYEGNKVSELLTIMVGGEMFADGKNVHGPYRMCGKRLGPTLKLVK